jgi:hypothetical protein
MISNIEFSEAYRKFGCPSVEVRTSDKQVLEISYIEK